MVPCSFVFSFNLNAMNTDEEDEQPVGNFKDRGSKRLRPKKVQKREKEKRERFVVNTENILRKIKTNDENITTLLFYRNSATAIFYYDNGSVPARTRLRRCIGVRQ